MDYGKLNQGHEISGALLSAVGYHCSTATPSDEISVTQTPLVGAVHCPFLLAFTPTDHV